MADISGKAARELRARERQKQILQLRLSGATYAAIAKQLEVSEVAIIKGYRRALRAIPAPEVKLERVASLERIDGIRFTLNRKFKVLSNQETTPENALVIERIGMALLRCEARTAMLLGLDAPREAKVAIEQDSRLTIETVREIMADARAARERHAAEEAEVLPPASTPMIEFTSEPADERQYDIEEIRALRDQQKAKQSA